MSLNWDKMTKEEKKASEKYNQKIEKNKKSKKVVEKLAQRENKKIERVNREFQLASTRHEIEVLGPVVIKPDPTKFDKEEILGERKEVKPPKYNRETRRELQRLFKKQKKLNKAKKVVTTSTNEVPIEVVENKVETTQP